MKQLFYILAAMAVVNWYTSSFYQMINATENVAWGTKLSIIPRIWMLVVLFVTVYCKMDIVLYFLLTYASLIITIPALVKKINREVKCLKFWPSFDKNTFREILPYGLNVFSFGFFQFSFYNLRPVFLGMQGSPEDVADFRVLNGIAGTAMMFASPVMSALLPSSSRIIANKDNGCIGSFVFLWGYQTHGEVLHIILLFWINVCSSRIDRVVCRRKLFTSCCLA